MIMITTIIMVTMIILMVSNIGSIVNFLVQTTFAIIDTVKDGSPGPNSGRPGIDYPNYHKIPETNFTCKDVSFQLFSNKCLILFYLQFPATLQRILRRS